MISIILAAARDGAIGRNGDLIWHIPDDLRNFKALTLGHPVIMGRKTWESLPKRPLPKRMNIVISRNPDFHALGAVTVASPEVALEAARISDPESSPFVIGGAQVYQAFLPLASELFLTEIDALCPDADAFFPFPPDPERWTLVSESPWQGASPRFRFLKYTASPLTTPNSPLPTHLSPLPS